jgi:FkbM family methyltransferase
MFRAVKNAGKRLFNAFGLEIRKKRAEPSPRANTSGALRQLSSLGFKPATVIDVGVAMQTGELYQEFKESKILLIEPVAEFEPFLRSVCERYEGEYVLAAAGSEHGTAFLNVHSEQLDCSSLLREVEGPKVDGVPREVPVVTIDQVCAEKGLAGPYLIKADVQGAELQVLSGAERTLRETEVVILEVTLFGTMIGGPQVYDVIVRMKEYGFVVYDIWGHNYRPYDNALAQVDMAFVREEGVFRQSHVFATPEQRKAFAWTPDPLLATGVKKSR